MNSSHPEFALAALVLAAGASCAGAAGWQDKVDPELAVAGFGRIDALAVLQYLQALPAESLFGNSFE